MLKIGTHNSATGEKGRGLLSWLVTPFAKCQKKTIREQYKAGCRLFDIRIRQVGQELLCAHGLWTSNRNAIDILQELDNLGECYVMLTYEGKLSTEQSIKDFIAITDIIKKIFKNILFLEVSVKKGTNNKWQTLVKSEYSCANRKGFISLDGSSWHTLLPIPWLWCKVVPLQPFNKDIYTLIDFL